VFEKTVVITDVATPADLQRCVHQVLKSVSRSVDVVVVGAIRHRFAPAVARRIRFIHVREAGEIGAAVQAEAVRPQPVTVIRSEVRVAPGWLEACLASSEEMPNMIGVLGAGDPHVVVYPAAVTWAGAPERVLAEVTLVSVPASGGKASAHRRTTIAAVLIVKDEADVVEACLMSVSPFVDEIVVYDTGSTDETRDIARRVGATVIEGYWDDDFGAARNRAVTHCRSEWVLSLDADEEVTGEPVALRVRLANESDEVDALRLSLVNTTWRGGEDGLEFSLARLFRRDRATWLGTLHEQLVAVDGELCTATQAAPIRLLHSGYHAGPSRRHNKGERNMAISRAAIDALPEGQENDPVAWCNHGRSLALGGDLQEALDAFEIVRKHPSSAASNVLASRTALHICLLLAQLDEFSGWVEFAQANGEAAGQVALWRARLAEAQGDLDAADDALAMVLPSRDLWGVAFNPDVALPLRAGVACRQGRPMDGLNLLLAALPRPGESVTLAALLQVAEAAGTSYDEVAAQVPETFVGRSLRECIRLSTFHAELWCRAVWSARHDRSAVVAGCFVASRLSMNTVLSWALAARETGLADYCPLRAIAGDQDRAPIDRAVATAVLAEALMEEAAKEVLDVRLAAVERSEWAPLRAALEAFAPTALDRFDSALAAAT
jgi:hypothetical protein